MCIAVVFSLGYWKNANISVMFESLVKCSTSSSQMPFYSDSYTAYAHLIINFSRWNIEAMGSLQVSNRHRVVKRHAFAKSQATFHR